LKFKKFSPENLEGHLPYIIMMLLGLDGSQWWFIGKRDGKAPTTTGDGG
jgi:hypothetical protein